jgi:hypothetical protein
MLGRKQATHDGREARMKRILVLTAALTALSFALAASAAPGGGTLTIRHQVKGCHSWSLNGGAWKTTQTAQLARGGSLVVTNNDVMFHKLVKVSGPAVRYTLLKTGTAMKGTVKLPWAPGMMGRPGATVKVAFPAKGTYVFKTVFGEDYMPMGDTVGEDNALRLVVTVS